MKLTEKYDALDNAYTVLGKEIIKDIDLYGLGVQPKSDIEALLFHCICNAIEDEYADNIQNLDYALMQLLRISPSKLRSLRITRSAKFLNNLDWRDPHNQLRIVRALKCAPIGNEDIRNGKIKIVISDPHIQNLIERMVEEKQGVLDRSFSARVLSLNAEQFLAIVTDIYGEGGEDGYDRTIHAIKEEAHDIHEELTKDNILDKFWDAFQEKSFEQLIKVGSDVAFKAIKRKLGID